MGRALSISGELVTTRPRQPDPNERSVCCLTRGVQLTAKLGSPPLKSQVSVPLSKVERTAERGKCRGPRHERGRPCERRHRQAGEGEGWEGGKNDSRRPTMVTQDENFTLHRAAYSTYIRAEWLSASPALNDNLEISAGSMNPTKVFRFSSSSNCRCWGVWGGGPSGEQRK